MEIQGPLAEAAQSRLRFLFLKLGFAAARFPGVGEWAVLGCVWV